MYDDDIIRTRWGETGLAFKKNHISGQRGV